MKKVRFALLALLVSAGAAFATNGAQSEEIYTIVDGNHPNVGAQGTFGQIAPLCPAPPDFVCATGDQGGVIFWSR